MFLIYIDDCTLFSQCNTAINDAIKDIWDPIQLEFTVEDQDNVNDFLGIQVKKHDDGTIHLLQLQLINSILKDLHLQDNTL